MISNNKDKQNFKIQFYPERHISLVKTSVYAFLAAFIGGYIVHLFAFTNIIPNADGISRVFDYQQMTVSGRWFLHYISHLHLFTQMPAVIGFLSCLFLGISAAFISKIISVGRLGSVLTGVLAVSFVSMGYTFLYMFTASSYSFAILLAVLSVYFARGNFEESFKSPTNILKFFLGAVHLALSMGIYQAYAALAAALAIISVICDCRDQKYPLRTLFSGLKLVLYLVLSAALYYIILRIFLKVKNLALLDYLGLKDVVGSGYPLGLLWERITLAYSEFFDFFFSGLFPAKGVPNWLVAGHWLILISGIIMLALEIIKPEKDSSSKQQTQRIGMMVFALILLPLAVGFATVISPFSKPSPIMKYSYIAAYILIISVVFKPKIKISKAKLIISGTALLGFILIIFSHMNYNNILYTASAQAHRATLSYTTRLVSAIEQTDGYQYGMPIMVVGGFPYQSFRADIESYHITASYIQPTHSVIPGNKHIYFYLRDWLNIPAPEPSEEEYQIVTATDAFKNMPLYPAKGSIAVLDGRLVVKISEKYKRKAKFEIEYENRR